MFGPSTPPSSGAAVSDLTDAEFAELDELLAATPEPLEPVDVVMLDGYLCGVLVQPVLIAPPAWLGHVFDFDGRPLPDDVDPVWRDRCTALILRRHAALNRALVEEGWFDPLVLEFDDNDEAGEASADAAAASEPMNPIQQALMPWVAGFQHAALVFPDLMEMPDDDVMASLARLYRHLPAETYEEREVVALLDREQPLATLDDAIEELVATVADLHDLTSDERFKVETVRRETPKVGRNDPCPCGSGKKFKVCHGG
jgi:uncharacterized protein